MSRRVALGAMAVTLAIAAAMVVGLWRIGVEVRALEEGALASELQLALSGAASSHPVDFERLRALGNSLATGRVDDLAARLGDALPDYSDLDRRVEAALHGRHPRLSFRVSTRVSRLTLLGREENVAGQGVLLAGPAQLPAGPVSARHALYLDTGGMALEVVFAAVCPDAADEIGHRLAPLRWGTLALLLLLAGTTATTLRAIVYARTVAAYQSDLLDTLAHELHTPLTTLHLGLRALADEPHGDMPGLLERLHRQVRRLQRLTERVTVASRTLLHDVTPDLTLLRPDAEISRALAERFGGKLSSGALRVDLDADAVQLLADRDDLEVLLGNLVENALKFTAHPDPRDEEAQRVLVTTAVRQRRLVVTVEDSGAGIDASVAHRLQRPFRHGGQAASGLGLGLYLCRRIARKLGGRLAIRRSDLGGACVVVSLPLYRRRGS